MKIGYLGPGKATFGFMAAEKFFNGRKHIEFVSFPNHTEICRAAGEGKITFGIVAAENVIEGVVTETIYAADRYGRMLRMGISGEVELPIELFLLRKANDGTPPTRLLSHTVSLRQCSEKVAAFRKSNNNIPAEAVDSNGKAAEIAGQDPSCVAISTAKAEQEYGLVRLEHGSITNNPNNFTRFWIVGLDKAKPTGKDKTCLLLNLDQPKPGGISRALAPFASRGINLLLIAPIPIPGKKWEYTFLVEFSGSFDTAMQEAYQELCASGISWDAPLVLGSYPVGTTK